MSFAPEARVLLRRPIPYAPRARLNSERRHRRSAGHIFSVLAEKIRKKRPLGRGIALTRRKNLSLRFTFYRYTVRSPNALRAAVESGFPSARYTVRVASFAPVEYLTYGSRKAVLPARATLHIAHRRAAMQNDPKQAQSISTATPVYQRRIRRAFGQSENKFRTNQAPGMIQGRRPQPPSWSF